jgi:hypothetical protein
LLELIRSAFESTEQLAVWGALTGSIGTITGVLSLYIRFRQQKQDQVKLKCEVDFNYQFRSGYSPIKNYKIVVRSVGRRPVTIDHVQYRFGSLEFPKKLQRWAKWRKGEWLKNVVPMTKTSRIDTSLTEGTKIQIPIDDEQIQISHVYKVNIVDQTGRFWPVSWPSHKNIKIITHYKELNNLHEEDFQKKFTLHGYEFQKEFRLEIYWNLKDGSSTKINRRYFKFDSRKKYTDKLNVLEREKIPAFLETRIADFDF